MSDASPICDQRATASADHFAGELIAATHAHRSDRIAILGAAQFELMIAFLRRGFDEVACIANARAADPTIEQPDIIIAPDIASETSLTKALRVIGHALRPGGVAVLRFAPWASFGTQTQLLPLFAACGFAAVERIAGNGADAEFWLARQPGKVAAIAA